MIWLPLLLLRLETVAIETPHQQSRVSVQKDAAIFDAEPALDKKIQISSNSMFLGELLELVSKESGLRFQLSDTGRKYNYLPLYVELRETTLRKVLWVVESLLSHRGAEWRWTQKAPKAPYVLIPSDAALAFSAKMKALSVQVYKKQVSDVLEAHDKVRVGEDLKDLDPEIRRLAETPLNRDRLTVLREAFSDTEIKDLLQSGGTSRSIDPSKLSEKSIQLSKELWNIDDSQLSNLMMTNGIDHGFGFGSMLGFGIKDGGSYGIFGTGIFGKRMSDYITDQWRTSRDQPESALEKQRLSKTTPTKKVSAELKFLSVMSERLSDISFLYIIPNGTETSSIRASDAADCRAFLQTINEFPFCIEKKWNNDILLMRKSSHVFQMDALPGVHWKFYETIHDFMMNKRIEAISIKEVIHAFNSLDIEEEREIGILFPPLASVSQWKPFFNWFDRGGFRLDELSSPQGMRVTTPLLIALGDTKQFGAASLKEASTARLVFQNEMMNAIGVPEGEVVVRKFGVELLDQKGKVLGFKGLFILFDEVTGLSR